MTRLMKLYVWEDVLEDWTSGVIFAHATSLGKAKKLVLAEFVRQGHEPDRALEEMNSHPPRVYTGETAGFCWGGA